MTGGVTTEICEKALEGYVRSKDKEEFPKGKEKYCPRFYFEKNKEVLREDCECKNDKWIKLRKFLESRADPEMFEIFEELESDYKRIEKMNKPRTNQFYQEIINKTQEYIEDFELDIDGHDILKIDEGDAQVMAYFIVTDIFPERFCIKTNAFDMTLEKVLESIKKSDEDKIISDLTIVEFLIEGEGVWMENAHGNCTWEYGRTFDKQSEKTKQFISEIISSTRS